MWHSLTHSWSYMNTPEMSCVVRVYDVYSPEVEKNSGHRCRTCICFPRGLKHGAVNWLSDWTTCHTPYIETVSSQYVWTHATLNDVPAAKVYVKSKVYQVNSISKTRIFPTYSVHVHVIMQLFKQRKVPEDQHNIAVTEVSGTCITWQSYMYW